MRPAHFVMDNERRRRRWASHSRELNCRGSVWIIAAFRIIVSSQQSCLLMLKAPYMPIVFRVPFSRSAYQLQTDERTVETIANTL